MANPTTGNDPASEIDVPLVGVASKDRTNIMRHLLACEADPSHAKLWRQLAGILSAHAPLSVQTVGSLSVLFFVPDGKYRMQAFALEDQRDGTILIYLPDVLDKAVKEKLIQPTDEPNAYSVGGRRGPRLRVHQLDSQNTPDPPPHFKNMLGWNRRALRITLIVSATSAPLIDAIDRLSALAVRTLVKPAAAKPAAK
jgi:hypothetical protein